MIKRMTALIVTILAMIQNTFAQTSLATYLDQLEDQYDVHFSYDASVAKEIQFNGATEVVNIAEALQGIVQQIPVNIDTLQTDYYSLDWSAINYQFLLKDSANHHAIGGVPVFFVVNGKTVAQSISTDDGQVAVTLSPLSYDVVQVIATQYESSFIERHILLNQKSIHLELAPETIYLNALVIEDFVTKGIDIDPANQQLKIRVGDLPALPGDTDGDVLASLATLPGISVSNGRAGNIMVRGSESDQSLILFNDIPIYHIGHFFGTISPYNPKIIEKVQVNRTGMHPRMGGRVGGAINLSSEQAATDQAKFGFGANTLYSTGYAKVPVIKGKWAISAAGRLAMPSGFESPKLKAISDMVYAASTVSTGVEGVFPSDFITNYADINVHSVARLSANTNLTFSGLFAHNNMGYYLNLENGRIKESNGFKNIGGSLKLKHRWDNGLTLENKVVFSEYGSHFDEAQKTVTYVSNSDIKDFQVAQELSWEAGQKVDVQVGWQYGYQLAHYYQTNEVENGKKGEVEVLEDTFEINSVAPYFNINWRPNLSWLIEMGSRMLYNHTASEWKMLSRMYALYDHDGKWMAKASAGRYYQMLHQIKSLDFSRAGFDNNLWVLAGDRFSGIDGAQLMVGGVLNMHSIVFDVEAYYKTSLNVTHSSSVKLRRRSSFSTADYRSNGVDFLLKENWWEHLDVWLGYSLSQTSLAMDSAKDVVYLSKFDQPHQMHAGMSYHKGGFSCTIGWKYASGLNGQTVEVQRERQNYIRKYGIEYTRQTQPFAGIPVRYAPVHQLDFAASYCWPAQPKWPFDMTLGLSVINVYDQDNLVDYVIRASEQTRLYERNSLAFAPNLMLMIEW